MCLAFAYAQDHDDCENAAEDQKRGRVDFCNCFALGLTGRQLLSPQRMNHDPESLSTSESAPLRSLGPAFMPLDAVILGVKFRALS